MYDTRRETKKFNTDASEDIAEYDAILNNPLCSILNERKEKLREEVFDGEGNLVRANEHIVLVVTWEEKTLL